MRKTLFEVHFCVASADILDIAVSTEIG